MRREKQINDNISHDAIKNKERGRGGKRNENFDMW
jgi:hypothetical protein